MLPFGCNMMCFKNSFVGSRIRGVFFATLAGLPLVIVEKIEADEVNSLPDSFGQEASFCDKENEGGSSLLPYVPDLVGRSHWADESQSPSLSRWQMGLSWQWDRMRARQQVLEKRCVTAKDPLNLLRSLQKEYFEPRLANLKEVRVLLNKSSQWLLWQFENFKPLLSQGEITLWEMDFLLGTLQSVRRSLSQVESQIQLTQSWLNQGKNSSPVRETDPTTGGLRNLHHPASIEAFERLFTARQDLLWSSPTSSQDEPREVHWSSELGLQRSNAGRSSFHPYASFEVRWHPGFTPAQKREAELRRPSWYLQLESIGLGLLNEKKHLEESVVQYEWQEKLIQSLLREKTSPSRDFPKWLAAFERLVTSSSYLLEWKGQKEYSMEWFPWDLNLVAKEAPQSPPRPSLESSLKKETKSSLLVGLPLVKTQGEWQDSGVEKGYQYFSKSSGFRAFSSSQVGKAVRAKFKYMGDSAVQKPLGSGELRTQLGLYTQALNQCNLVYVMVRLKPKPMLVVQQKLNKGMSTHSQCLNRGYQTLFQTKMNLSNKVPLELHLGASYQDGQLTVYFNQEKWAKVTVAPELQGSALKAGVRMDNVEAFFQLEEANESSLTTSSPN
jgi:hypothetical protein